MTKIIISNQAIFNQLFLDDNGELKVEFSQNVINAIAKRYAHELVNFESEAFIKLITSHFKDYLLSKEYDRKESKWVPSGYNRIAQEQLSAIVKDVTAQRISEINQKDFEHDVRNAINTKIDEIIETQLHRINDYITGHLNRITTDLIKSRIDEALKNVAEKSKFL